MSPSSTRTTLFGIFVLAGKSLTASQLIDLARPLGISATNLKSHLTRLVAEGALERTGPRRASRYAISRNHAAVVAGIAARLEPQPEERWDGAWLSLSLTMPISRAERDRLRAALWFDGFRPCNGTTFLRPAWPREWVLTRARSYLERVPGIAVLGSLFGGIAADRLYDLDGLDREARRLTRRIRSARAPAQSPARAFAARLHIGGLVARLVGHDPRLPESLWGKRRGIRELLREFVAFERRMRPGAARFLAEVLG